MTPIFKLEDFHYLFREEPVRLQEMADVANAKIKEWLDQAPKVFSCEWERKDKTQGCEWTLERADGDTHRARLVCIEKLTEEK